MVLLSKIKWLPVVLLMAIAGCNKMDVFEKTVSFPMHQWSSANKPKFTFTVTDTLTRYNVFIVLRHTDAYHYNNIWLNITTIPPGDTAQTTKANLKLGDNQQWLGSSLDDVIEHRIRINQYPLQLKAGDNIFILQQIMREDPLPEIMNAGVRVEKAK